MTSSNRFPRLFAVGAALAAGLLLHDAASAQDQRPREGARWEQGARQDPAQRTERRVEQITRRLQLSADQAAQVRRILEEERGQMQALRGDRREGGDARPRQGAGGDGARRQGPSPEVRALRERTEQQIEGVLNDGQRAEYRELRERREERGDRPRGERGRRRPATQTRG